jgi:sugar O-acyltransferase (sialic acid O-acetyltransferase NeuD family)
MRKPLFIYGAGGLGREILSLIKALEEWEPVGFIDDAVTEDTVVNGLKVKGGMSVIDSFRDPAMIILAIADPMAKSALASKITNRHVQYPTLIHPSAILQQRDTIRLGEGTILTAGVILTTDITVGAHVLINLNATIGHNASIGNFTSIMPGVNIAGEVIIKESVFIGSGVNIRNRVTIGDRSIVGMGAAVISDVSPGLVVGGVPAKPLQR